MCNSDGVADYRKGYLSPVSDAYKKVISSKRISIRTKFEATLLICGPRLDLRALSID